MARKHFKRTTLEKDGLVKPKKNKMYNNGQLRVNEVDRLLEKLHGQQLSNAAIQSICRAYASECIDVLVDIMRTGKMETARLGAAKVLLSKVIPDLKAVEISGSDSIKGLVIVKDNKPIVMVEDATLEPVITDNSDTSTNTTTSSDTP